MENGSEIEEKVAVLNGESPANSNGSAILGDDHSFGIAEEKSLEVDLTEAKPVDYSGFSKKEFVELLKEAATKNHFKKADDLIRDIKPLFDEIRVREKSEALSSFKEEGGIDDDFQYRNDEWDAAFDIYLKSIRDNRQRHFKELEEQKNSNLLAKNAIREKLRHLADGEDTEHSLRQFKEIQKEWKVVGQVPQSQIKTLWANYNALVDRFYDQRSIYFELKELDRKKNLELKQELCARADKLLDEKKIGDAVKELNELHNEFRHIGPVPIEEKESKDWEKASNELKDLQLKWKEIGTVPEKHREKIFKQFKEACDFFFDQRRQSNDKEAGEQKENLVKKEAIISLLEKIVEEKSGSLNQVKELQSQFMSIGFVPKRDVNSLKSRFSETLTKAIAALPDLGAEEKDQATFEVRLSNMKQSPQGEMKIHHKEHHLRKQIARAENDIATLRNNLEFFGRSKNAEKMKEEFNAKIKLADEEIVHLKKQLQMLQASA